VVIGHIWLYFVNIFFIATFVFLRIVIGQQTNIIAVIDAECMQISPYHEKPIIHVIEPCLVIFILSSIVVIIALIRILQEDYAVEAFH
jgi:hypothetical protein